VLNVVYAECHKKPFMINVIMLNVIVLCVVKLNVVALTKDPKAMVTALDVLCNLQIGPIS